MHRPVAEEIIHAVQEVFGDGRYTDKVLERTFKQNRKLGARDRKQIAEAVYGIVRWWRLLWAALGAKPSLESDEVLRLVGAWLLFNKQPLPVRWPESAAIDLQNFEYNLRVAEKNLAIRESIPDWLFAVGSQELEKDWPSLINQLNREAPVCLRANRLKVSREELIEKLAAEGIQTRVAPETDDGLILKERKNLFSSESFRLGLFEVQDGASQQIAPLLDLKPGLRVIDACAGAGGKTLSAAAVMKNKGKIIALDTVENKLTELKRRAARAGVDIVEAKLIDSNKVIKRLENSADRVLLDVPCSGLGVLRRNPDTKWKLQAEELSRLNNLQAEILAAYSRMVKPGGKLVYATCSILPSENERQIHRFLADNPEGWELVLEKKFPPGLNGYDGFYAAVLNRQSFGTSVPKRRGD